ncbi:MAG: nucleotidyltransferase family protein [Acetobacteraceae bacterium]|nr:nucleotidyltransferase family protein [Acetobacteraceae bacterium]
MGTGRPSGPEAHASSFRAVLFNDPLRWRLLALARSLALPDCWIGAGFVGNAVWDHPHGRPPAAAGRRGCRVVRPQACAPVGGQGVGGRAARLVCPPA